MQQIPKWLDFKPSMELLKIEHQLSPLPSTAIVLKSSILREKEEAHKEEQAARALKADLVNFM